MEGPKGGVGGFQLFPVPLPEASPGFPTPNGWEILDTSLTSVQLMSWVWK